MGKYIGALAKKQTLTISEVSENHTSLTCEGEEKEKKYIKASSHLLPKLPKVSWRERDAAYWERVRQSVSPGAVTICGVLQSWNFLDEPGFCPSANHLFREWSEVARDCNAKGRDLTDEEREGLEKAKGFLRLVEREWENSLP